jgi:hypothetical protein
MSNKVEDYMFQFFKIGGPKLQKIKRGTKITDLLK